MRVEVYRRNKHHRRELRRRAWERMMDWPEGWEPPLRKGLRLGGACLLLSAVLGWLAR